MMKQIILLYKREAKAHGTIVWKIYIENPRTKLVLWPPGKNLEVSRLTVKFLESTEK